MARKVKREVAVPKVQNGGRVSQSDFPSTTLENARKVAQAIYDEFAGQGAAPHDVALAAGFSPTSSAWRVLCGASIAYGLTDGGYNADEIKLTTLGRRLVAPTEEGDVETASVEAVLKPKIIRQFFERYDRAKFPQDAIAQNVLASMGLPRDRAGDALSILKENGRSVGLIRETKTGPFVALTSSPKSRGHEADAPPENRVLDPTENLSGHADEFVSAEPVAEKKADIANSRVFISHGRNKSVVAQIKELLTFGGFEPIISVEHERTAIPVPDKVFQDMRSCAAGVIHVNSEGSVLDADGNTRVLINQNVLIEIGGAIALYGKRVVLLVERGIALPSNLQGLYRCEYEGEKLDYDATMKLLKTFNEFKVVRPEER